MLMTRKAQKENTRLALRDAALRCFERKGFAGTQIADVTALAGVAKGTFYVHFTDKESLLDGVLTDFIARLAEVVRPVLSVASRAPLEYTVEHAARASVALFREERERMTALLGPHNGRVGAFEGAMYEARGHFRPQADCIMFTRDRVPFCAPCARAIERVIDLYSRPPGP